MKNIFTLSVLLALVMAGCSDSESAQGVSPTNSDILAKLDGSSWSLVEGCPDHTFLSINGYSECQYLEYLLFDHSKVFIKHYDNNYMTPHHICFVDGNRLVVSIQECSNTTWRSMFEWEVVSMSGSFLTLKMVATDIAPTYNFRFTYQKAG